MNTKKLTDEEFKRRKKIRLAKYREENKEKIKESDSSRYFSNQEEIKKKQKLKRDSSKRLYSEKQLLRKKELYLKNKEKIKEYHRNYLKNKKATDPLFKLKILLRSRILECFRVKNYTKRNKTINILGCSFEDFKQYIEMQWQPWMNWDNHGLYNGELNYGWDLDHIIPISSAKTQEDVIRLNHYSNFKPLCSKTNRYIKKNNPILEYPYQ